MRASRHYNVYGAEFSIESDFPKLTEEFDKDFGRYPSQGVAVGGVAHVIKEKDVAGMIPECALLERANTAIKVFSSGERRFFLNTRLNQLVVIPSPKERTFFCYAGRYSNQLFCTVRNLVKYVVVSLLEDRGVYYIHGAAVSKNDAVAVITAKSGFGKTRSLLSLAGKGFKLVTDDVVFFREENFRILSFRIRGNVDGGHVEAFPELRSLVDEYGMKPAVSGNYWFLHLTDLLEAEGGNPFPSVLVRLLRWNSKNSQFRDASKDTMLADLMASYREFGSGVYFTSGKTRGDVFSFYSRLLENVRVIDFRVGTDPVLFAEEFEKLFD